MFSKKIRGFCMKYVYTFLIIFGVVGSLPAMKRSTSERLGGSKRVHTLSPTERLHVLLSEEGDVDASLFEAQANELIDAGADITVRGDFGFNVLDMAVQKGCPVLMQKLLAAGADVNAKNDDDFTSIWHAVEARDLEAMDILAAHGARLNDSIEDVGNLLELAITSEWLEGITWLLEHGAYCGERERAAVARLNNRACSIITSEIEKYRKWVGC